MYESNMFNFDEAAVSQMENIRRIGLRRLRNRGEIDDFVQETLTRAYAKRDQLRDEAKFDRWIAVIARNLAAEWNRSAFYRNEREEPIDEIPEPPDFKTPHDILEEKEEREQLHRAMGRLNEDDREMLRDRYFEDASYQELQQKYGLSYSAVGFRLHRAKARLRKLLTSTAAAFAAFAGFGRAALGGTLLMTNSTKIAVGAAAVAAGVLIGGYIWIHSGGEETDAAPNDNPLTIEEQSPRIAPRSDQKSSGSQSAERADRQPEADEGAGDSAAPTQSSDVESQTADSAGNTEPSDAPATDPEKTDDETKSAAEAYEAPMRYRFEGLNIVADLEIPYDIALNGGKVSYKVPDGSLSWTVEFPPGSLLRYPGQVLTEEGLGLADEDKTGDFIVHLNVVGK